MYCSKEIVEKLIKIETESVSRVRASPVEAVPRTNISAWAAWTKKGARSAIAKPQNLNLCTNFP